MAEELIQGRYRLEERLGGVGERSTWLARDEHTGEKVVFKALFFGPGTAWQNYRLFEREAQILPTLNHPGIPQFHATFWSKQAEGHYFCLVQRFVPGSSLNKWMDSGHRFDEGQQVELAAQLLAILVYLHAQQPPLVHRDIKPSNILLDREGKVFLVDFGAVQAMGQDGQTATAAGTFGYMAPEQFLGRAVPASDLFGLGTTLTQLLTGIPPVGLRRDSSVLEPEYPALQSWFGQWLKRMVQPDLSRRFVDGQEAVRAFEELRRGGVIYECLSVPPSDLKRFVVQEASRQRLSVDLLADGVRQLLKYGALPGLLLTILGIQVALDHGKQELAHTLSYLFWVLPSCGFFLQLLPAWGTRLEIDGKRFSLSWVIGRLTFLSRQIELGPQVELKVIQPDDPEVHECRLELWQGECPHRFTARLSAEELQWLRWQFLFHRDRTQQQENLLEES